MDKMTAAQKIEEFFQTSRIGEVYRVVIDLTEKALIEKALERSLGNQLGAAKVLGLNRNTLRMKIKKFNIDTRQFKRQQ